MNFLKPTKSTWYIFVFFITLGLLMLGFWYDVLPAPEILKSITLFTVLLTQIPILESLKAIGIPTGSYDFFFKPNIFGYGILFTFDLLFIYLLSSIISAILPRNKKD